MTSRIVSVGSRELKTRLGTYLREVRSGKRLVVTERGRPIAELRPIGLGGLSLEAELERLDASGLVTAPHRSLPALRGKGGKSLRLAQAIVAGREDRF